jgi:hypothetical protein
VAKNMTQQTYQCYSVDASVMIDLKDFFPTDLFQSVWDEISRLVAADRWKIFETVADELHDTQLEEWLSANIAAEVKFNPDINNYLNRFMAECQNNNMVLINPYNTRNNGDPFVVMLALYYEGRDLTNLRIKKTGISCCVITDERPREHKVNIPYVCDYYSIPHMHLFDLMRYHQWQVSINVQNP